MPQDNRLLIAIGAGLAIVAAVVLALVFSSGRGGDNGPPPAAQGGLTVDVADAPELNTTRELRCFVNGQFIGMATLTDCARRNGLATDALDVGIDETGALAAAPTAGPVRPGPLRRPMRGPSGRRPVWPLGRPDAAAGAAPGGTVERQQPFPRAGRTGPQLPISRTELMRISSVAAIAGVLTSGLLAGCAAETKAPFDQGVCYSVALPDPGEKAEPRFNVLARDQPQIESCAAQLEMMRVRFLSMGGSHNEIVGSYQGQFIFLDRAGVWFGKTIRRV
jgi:hypothetical protein